jgi:2-C-methyl-D-erythritol 4-phosphate cytidylyltransferase
VPAVPIPDTVKRVDGDRVVETIDRDGLVVVQTPQAFRADRLRAAHEGGGDATDDAALVEAVGGTVVVVAGDPRNVKVTTVADLTVVEALLAGSEER